MRIALRMLWRAPGPTAVALLSIALSIGATSVVFAAVQAVLLNPLPYRRPDQLVLLRADSSKLQKQSAGDWVVWNDTREIARRTRTLGTLGGWANAVFDLAGDQHSTPEALYGVQMNSDLFPVLGVTPMLGRNVLPEEDQPDHAPVMILAYALWVRRFHSDRSIVGRTVLVQGQSCQIIGVMPPEFNFPLRREAAHTPAPYVEFWTAPLKKAPNPAAAMCAVARLRPGVSLAAARQEIDSISRDLQREFPALNRDRVLSINLLRDRMVGQASKSLALLMGAALLFMLIGCANVANLLLARGLGRQREIAIRIAIGASRARIIRQLLTESCVLAALGGFAGYLLTAVAWKILPALAPVSIPRLAAARAGTPVFAFALILAVANGLLFGLAPALRAARGIPRKQRDRTRALLVATEIAVCVFLVITGGEVLSAFLRLIATDTGYQPDRVLASVVLPAPARYPDPEKRALFYHRILDAARAIPGVESAGTVDAFPFSGENDGGSVSTTGASDPQQLTAEIDTAGGDYLQSLGLRLEAGRWFQEDEMRTGNDSAIVSKSVAQRLWPGADPIGQRICAFCTPENPSNWKRVVGVVSDSPHAALDDPAKANVYLAANAMRRAQFLVVRTTRPEGEMSVALRRAIAALDPNQPVLLTASLRDLISDSVADRRFIALLLSITGCLALAMAAAGVYGVMSYTTSRRTSEVGIRMAIGATPANILSLIFREGALTVSAGLAVGIAASLAFTHVGTGSAAIAVALVTITAAPACWIPARRAACIDPMAALREE
jgi:putative ABC transport system permease protein